MVLGTFRWIPSHTPTFCTPPGTSPHQPSANNAKYLRSFIECHLRDKLIEVIKIKTYFAFTFHSLCYSEKKKLCICMQNGDLRGLSPTLELFKLLIVLGCKWSCSRLEIPQGFSTLQFHAAGVENCFKKNQMNSSYGDIFTFLKQTSKTLLHCKGHD